jgi:hypothetical protein
MVCLWRGSRDANGGRHSHLGKGAQRALRQAVRRSCAVAWSGTGRGIGGHTYAESGRAPATIFSLSLPPCFPGFAEPGGEARNGPGGPSEAIDFIDEIWSGRRDSNPRPQPWLCQGNLVRTAGLEPALSERNRFSYHFGFRRRHSAFVAWTVPSPWPLGRRRRPSSLYTFPQSRAWLGIGLGLEPVSVPRL